jgi:hypothetical protein
MRVGVQGPGGQFILDTASGKPLERLLARVFSPQPLCHRCSAKLQPVERFCHGCGRASHVYDQATLLWESTVQTLEEGQRVWGCSDKHPDDTHLPGHCPVCGKKFAE